MELTLIGHTAVDVLSGICYGFSDVPLLPSFESEATQVKAHLDGKSFEIIYTSPLSRCAKLTDFCGYKKAIRDDRLKELNFGDWEMKSWMQIDKAEASKWFADWLNFPAKNGESYAQMRIRINNFLDELKSSGKSSACIFTHSGVIRLTHVYAGVCPIEESFEFPAEYGQIFQLTI
jgi:alpha-ribazole phosphatase